jgi:hypothetical protein
MLNRKKGKVKKKWVVLENIILDDEVRGFLMGCLAYAWHDSTSDFSNILKRSVYLPVAK